MESASLYDAAYNAISNFYWEQYSTWMALLLAALLWTPVVVAFRFFSQIDKQAGDRGTHTIVALPPREKLAFPEFCVGCGKATAPDAFVTVTSGIGAGMAQEFAATPGMVVGHSVKWNLPSCTNCATNDSWSQAAPLDFGDIFIWAVVIIWLVFVSAGFTLVISAMDFLQLIWLLPLAAILLFAMCMPAIWLKEFASRQWGKLRGREHMPVGLKNPLPSVFFRIEKVEHLPGGMPERALPWGPHVYHFMFEHSAYAERFKELNGGISAPFDSAGRREVSKPFRLYDYRQGALEFGLAFAISFLIVLALAGMLAIFGVVRFGVIFSLSGLGVIGLLGACLALVYTLEPGESPQNDD